MHHGRNHHAIAQTDHHGRDGDPGGRAGGPDAESDRLQEGAGLHHAQRAPAAHRLAREQGTQHADEHEHAQVDADTLGGQFQIACYDRGIDRRQAVAIAEKQIGADQRGQHEGEGETGLGRHCRLELGHLEIRKPRARARIAARTD